MKLALTALAAAATGLMIAGGTFAPQSAEANPYMNNVPSSSYVPRRDNNINTPEHGGQYDYMVTYPASRTTTLVEKCHGWNTWINNKVDSSDTTNLWLDMQIVHPEIGDGWGPEDACARVGVRAYTLLQSY